MSNALLPPGFHDSLYPEAAKKAEIVHHFYKFFSKYGYELVEPPVIEFENSLLNGSGLAYTNKTFRLMDPISHNMMGIRADITTQIARIAVTRLHKENLPIRLSYNGEVFRVKGEGLYSERQLTQTGIELIGANSPNVDAEVVWVIVSALSEIGIKGICVDFTMPLLTDIILQDLKLSQEEREALLVSINKKDVQNIEKFLGKEAKIILDILGRKISPENLDKIKIPAKAKKMWQHFKEVVSIIQESGLDVTISIDPLDNSKFAYHSGIGFSIFSKGAKSELGRGGRYEIQGQRTVPASGATIYINEILCIIPNDNENNKVYVPFGTKWQDINKIITKDKKRFIFSASKENNLKKAAKEQNCRYILQDNKIKPIYTHSDSNC